MKKSVALLIVAILTITALLGCNSKGEKTSQQVSAESSTSKSGNSEKKHYKFGFTAWTMNSDFFQIIKTEIQKQVEANGDTLIVTDPAQDQQKQINQIEDMIAQGIDAIFLNPVDLEGIKPALVALKKKNIPIINFDTGVKDIDYIASLIASDNYNAGAVDAQDLIKRFPNGGPIAVIDMPANSAVRERIQGFLDTIKGKNFNIVAQQDGKGNTETGLQVATDILQANPKLLAIMAGNDPSALGAYAATKAANNTKVLIYGVDGSPEAKAEIAKKGQFVATGAQSPVKIGQSCIDTMYKILKGESYKKNIAVPTFLIDVNNVEQYLKGWQ